MVDKRRCPRCRCVFFEDEWHDCLPGASGATPAPEPEKAAPEPPKPEPRAKLPRYDFYLQEAEDDLAKRFGRENAETLIDDWDENDNYR